LSNAFIISVGVDTVVGAPDNAVTLLKKHFSPEVRMAVWCAVLCEFSDAPPSQDFVVVKLDIDNTPIEEAVIKEIMTDPEAVARVDELMFGAGTTRTCPARPPSYRPAFPRPFPEHHYYSVDTGAFWGLAMKTSILESFDLFTSLRKLGFVAHVWP